MSKENIVCLCNHITEEDIIEAVKNGASNLEDVKTRTGARSGICKGGRCSYRIKHIIEDYR
ncbi:(2Fe-2S)-binding protein [Clostridium senegalense]|uniref:(2Fe-2S)-binding protein n=1 Tax=Clostridium senegalense TaxID=1465809 RepID=UPI00028845D8|nr:(2Fe-2S)-binding protein [Clostridium senegalense]MBU5227289.1 (2Fe-2S)-binding protein [Clostridium senegalense]